MYIAEIEYFLSCVKRNMEPSPSLLESKDLIETIIAAKDKK
jgi:hypothetical protein